MPQYLLLHWSNGSNICLAIPCFPLIHTHNQHFCCFQLLAWWDWSPQMTLSMSDHSWYKYSFTVVTRHGNTNPMSFRHCFLYVFYSRMISSSCWCSDFYHLVFWDKDLKVTMQQPWFQLTVSPGRKVPLGTRAFRQAESVFMGRRKQKFHM